MELRQTVRHIFNKAVDAVSPEKMIEKCIQITEGIMTVKGVNQMKSFNLSQYENIYLVGAGKASGKMAIGLQNVAESYVTKGFVSVKSKIASDLQNIKMIQAGHPVPDTNSIRAGKEILELCKNAGKQDLVISLISGGGSALLEYPLCSRDFRINLQDIQDTTKLLLDSGASITEVNTVRKHLSAVKGGRLAEAVYPAHCVTLILSDVVGDDLSFIASGLTVPDPTSFADTENVLTSYDILSLVPDSVKQIIMAGKKGHIPDTPKQGDSVFEHTDNILLGSNISALQAAAQEAKSMGFTTVVLSSRITGESREIAKYYAGIALDIGHRRSTFTPPICLIAGGETTVTIRGNGLGGRNQEMVLSFAHELKQKPEALNNGIFLSAGTDGNDGPTNSAGGICDKEVLKAISDKQVNSAEYLKNNDSYHFLEEVGGQFKPGATNTNVCDIQILIQK
ncbi:MAG: glycerate kinase [Spirochaetia bacterium]